MAPVLNEAQPPRCKFDKCNAKFVTLQTAMTVWRNRREMLFVHRTNGGEVNFFSEVVFHFEVKRGALVFYVSQLQLLPAACKGCVQRYK